MAKHSANQYGLPPASDSQDAGTPLFDGMGELPVWDEDAVTHPASDQPPEEEPQEAPQVQPPEEPRTDNSSVAAVARPAVAAVAVEISDNLGRLSQAQAALYAAMEHRIAKTSQYIEDAGETKQTPEKWNANRHLIANNSHKLLGEVLALDTRDGPEQAGAQQNPFDAALRDVYVGFLASQDGLADQDGADLIAGSELLTPTGSDVSQGTAGAAKITDTLRALTLWGMYKLGHHANLAQLGAALNLIEQYSHAIPGLDPDKAGLSEAESAIEVSLAALEADRRISSAVGIDIDEAQPYHGPLTSQLWAKVEQAATIRARHTVASR